MTPTLPGRWQIRFFLFFTIGLLIALLVGLLVQNVGIPLLALFYMFLLGIALDLLYQYIQSFRWDGDWPTSFQVGAGIAEGILVWGLIRAGLLPGLPRTMPFIVFLFQYGLTWLSIFSLTQGLLRVFWPQWRYQGGQWFMFPSMQTNRVISMPDPLKNFVQPPQATPLFICTCGYASDRSVGKFCPQCGKPH